MSSFDRRNTYQFWTKSLLYDTSHSHKINIAIALMLRVLNSNNPTFWCWCTKINHNLVENYNYIPQEEFSYLNIHLNANSNIAEKINCKLARVFWIGVKEQDLDLQVKIVNKCCMRQWALTLAHMATGWSLVTPGLGLIWLDIGLVHQAQPAQPSPVRPRLATSQKEEKLDWDASSTEQYWDGRGDVQSAVYTCQHIFI